MVWEWLFLLTFLLLYYRGTNFILACWFWHGSKALCLLMTLYDSKNISKPNNSILVVLFLWKVNLTCLTLYFQRNKIDTIYNQNLLILICSQFFLVFNKYIFWMSCCLHVKMLIFSVVQWAKWLLTSNFFSCFILLPFRVEPGSE